MRIRQVGLSIAPFSGVKPEKSNQEYRPRLVFWELTTGCNLRCRHCRASATELMSPDDLSLAECLHVVDQLSAYAPLILVLSGGEPLWRRDVFDIARYAVARRLRVALATNGTLVDEAMAERIKAAGIERVAISLDGASPETHDRFRGIDGAFRAAVWGLECLNAAGVSTQINSTVTRHNVEELPALLQFASRMGVTAFHLFLLVPVGCGLAIMDEDSVDPGQAEEILTWFYEQSLTSSLELKATCAPHYYRIVRQRRARARRAGIALAPLPTHGMHAMTKGCLAGTGVCFVSHQGEVYPCGYLPVSAGNLREEPFQKIWDHAEVFARLRHPEQLEGKCGICEFRQVCMGCRARAFGMTGNYMAEEPGCNYQPGAVPLFQ
jgi:heme b synthase